MNSKKVRVNLEGDSNCANLVMVLEDIEEGEFTSVVSKKTQKLSKQAVNKAKVVTRKPVARRASLLWTELAQIHDS